MKKDIFDEIAYFLLMVLTIPFAIGIVFGKYVLLGWQYNFVLNKTKKQKKFLPVSCLSFLIFFIFIAIDSYGIIVLINSFSILVLWLIVIWIIVFCSSLSFYISIVIGFLYILINFNNLKKKYEKNQIVEIIAKPEKENKKISFNKIIYFICNINFIEKWIEKFYQQITKQNLENYKNGVVLSKEKNIIIEKDVLNLGTIIFGTTGSGKTNTLKLFIEYGIKNKENIIFINGKADWDLCKDLKNTCEKNNYNLKVWSPTFELDEKNKLIYNPFKDKNANLITSLLMEISRYSSLEESGAFGNIYYKDNEQACINLICKALIYKQKNHAINDKRDYSTSLDNLFIFADLDLIGEIIGFKNLLNNNNESTSLAKLIVFKNKINTYINDLKNNKKTKINYDEIKKEVFYLKSENQIAEYDLNWFKEPNDFFQYLEKEIIELQNKENNKEIVNNIQYKISQIKDDELRNIFEDYDDTRNDIEKIKAFKNIKTTFKNLRNLNTSQKEKIISNLGKSIKELMMCDQPTLYLFSLDTTGLKTQSSALARMLISDIKQNMNVIRQNNAEKKILLLMDEFGSFATPDIVELQEQGRSKGFEIVYAIQTISNLTQISPNFANRIIGNCNTYIIHRVREDQGVEQLANIIGTNPMYEATERYSEGEATGEMSIRAVQHYIFNPREIRQLKNFEALICTVKNNELIPYKEAIKIDYANISEFKFYENLNKNINNNILKRTSNFK